MTIVDDELDLFAEQTTFAPTEPTARITCRVCNLTAEVLRTAPAKLCPECAGDLDQARERIASRLHAAMWSAQDAWNLLDADVAHADETTLGRWNAFQDAITNNDPRAQETERLVAGGIKGDFAALVRRWVAWKSALDLCAATERWATQARAEVEAYETHT